MTTEMIFLLACVATALGAMASCFYFAKKDWPVYAVFSFCIATACFLSAWDAVKLSHRINVAQTETPTK